MNLLSVKGVNGNYGGEAYRTGELCKVCGNIIQRIKLGGQIIVPSLRMSYN
jgi:formamidopyrimidine-DNA glycosylase